MLCCLGGGATSRGWLCGRLSLKRPWFGFGRFSLPRLASFLGGLNERTRSLPALPGFGLLLRSFAEGELFLFGGVNERNPGLLAFPRFGLLVLRSFGAGVLFLLAAGLLPLFGGVNERNPSLFPRFALLFAGRFTAGEATRASFGDIAGG